jgi:hypothetical protein
MDEQFQSLQELKTEKKRAGQAHQALASEKATLLKQLESLKVARTEQANQLATLEENAAQAQEQHLKALKELEEENQLILEQLHIVQEELERYILQGQEQEKSLEHARQQVRKEGEETQRLQHRLTQLRERFEQQGRDQKRLNADLAENQDYILQLKEAQQRSERDHALALAAANQKIATLNNTLNQLRGSATWRATGPVRSIAGVFKSERGYSGSLMKDKQLVSKSRLFDTGWYLATYPDVAEKGKDPIEHYLISGAAEGRNPGPDFDTIWYLTAYSDVVESGKNPLIHYIKFGQHEQRSPKPGSMALLSPPEAQASEEPSAETNEKSSTENAETPASQ